MLKKEKVIDDFVNDNLNNVSKTFCLAKYDQFTVQLHLGAVQSCHLSHTNKINESMIEHPFSYFNFKEIVDLRKKMKKGEQINACEYCWKIENSTNLNSERHTKSFFLQSRFEEIKNMNLDEDIIIPSYLELSFSNLCNFKCSYCSAKFSSRWERDIIEKGEFNVKDSSMTKYNLTKNNLSNVVDIFWIHFPEILKNLKTLRITGGEPTIQKELYTNIFDYLIANPRPDLELSINTNLGANKKILDKFISKIKLLKNKVKNINIFTSCDTSGEHAEFIREGLNYDYWKSNCYRILNELDFVTLNFMCTFNNLCLSNNFITFINDINDMTIYSIGKKERRVFLNIELLLHPEFQSIDFLDYDLFRSIITKIENEIEKMEVIIDKDNLISSKGFSRIELNKFFRIKKIISSKNKKNDLEIKNNFLLFLEEISRRNNKNYLDIFKDNQYIKFFERIKNKKNDDENDFLFDNKFLN